MRGHGAVAGEVILGGHVCEISVVCVFHSETIDFQSRCAHKICEQDSLEVIPLSGSID